MSPQSAPSGSVCAFPTHIGSLGETHEDRADHGSGRSTAPPVVRLRHAIGTQLATESSAPIATAIDVDAAAWASGAAAEAFPPAVADYLEQSERCIRTDEYESFALVGPGAERPGLVDALELRRRTRLLQHRVQCLHGLGSRGGVEGSRQPRAELARPRDVIVGDRIRRLREAVAAQPAP